MTSRSASRNAMTQVDDDLRSRYIMGRVRPRFFVQVGHEAIYASRAGLLYEMAKKSDPRNWVRD